MSLKVHCDNEVLHVKIRELEAELADLRTYRDLHYCGEKGIVERATAELKARAEKAEARVAELVKELSKFAPIRYEEMVEDGLIEREAD